MPLTSAQLKGRIKSLASKINADARNLLRIYAMERFLERLSVSSIVTILPLNWMCQTKRPPLQPKREGVLLTTVA